MNKIKFLYYSLPSIFLKISKIFFSKLYNPIIYDFIFSPIGQKYGVTKKQRIMLLKKFMTVIENVDSATSLETHITLAKYLLSLPKSKNEFVVECGCFKGASSCSISIICKIIGKRLIIYDSFEGLPSITKNNKTFYPHIKVTEKYKQGMYKGNLDVVKKNLINYGEFSQCIFRKGFFEKTLPSHKEKVGFIFLDVDLPNSTKACIKNLWKYLKNDGYIFTDDSCDMDNVKIWFDTLWWMKNLNTNAPGYIGSGCGLPLNGPYSGLGYSIKKPNIKKFSSKNKFHLK